MALYSPQEMRARQMREYEHPKEDILESVTIRVLRECNGWEYYKEVIKADNSTTIKDMLSVTIGDSVLSVGLSVTYSGKNGTNYAMTVAMGDCSTQISIPYSGESNILHAFNDAVHDAKKRANERMIEEIVSFLDKK